MNPLPSMALLPTTLFARVATVVIRSWSMLAAGLTLLGISPALRAQNYPVPCSPELALSQGHYPEVFGNDTLRRIGNWAYNTVSGRAYQIGGQGQVESDVDRGAEGIGPNRAHGRDDMKVGRFLSLDPLAATYPHNSPYAFSENRLLDGIELEGLERHPFMYLPQWAQEALIKADRAERIISAAGRGLATVVHDLAPIRPADENDPQNLSEAWQRIKQTPENLKALPGLVAGVYENGSAEDKTELSVSLLGTIVSSLKGKPNLNNGILQAGFKMPKLVGAGMYGQCGAYARDFMNKVAPGLRKEGATVSQFEINIGKGGTIGMSKIGLSDNGMHRFSTVMKDGVTTVFDNMHPNGIEYGEFVKDLGGRVAGTSGEISGAQLINEFTTKLQ